MDQASAFLEGRQQVIDAQQRKDELAQRAVQSRLAAQQAQDQLNQQIQARQQQQQQEADVERQRIAVQSQMTQQRIALETQRVEQQKQAAADKAKESAETMAQTRGFYGAIASGMPTAEAAYRFPKARQGAISGAGIDDRSAERLAEKRREDQEKFQQNFNKESDAVIAREDKATAAKRAAQAKEDKPPVVNLKLPGDQGSIRLPENDPQINQLLGDQAPPGMGTNFQRSAAPPNVPQGKQFKEGQVVRNKKDGKLYVIKNGVPVPQSQEEE